MSEHKKIKFTIYMFHYSVLHIWGGTHLFYIVDLAIILVVDCRLVDQTTYRLLTNMFHNICGNVDQKHLIVVNLLIKNTAKAV